MPSRVWAANPEFMKYSPTAFRTRYGKLRKEFEAANGGAFSLSSFSCKVLLAVQNSNDEQCFLFS